MRKQFDFYGYNSPTDGRYHVDDETYFLGEDYRSVRRYKEYQNVGFNILLLQHMNEYNGEKWETSSCKKCMDVALKSGIQRIIVSDKRLKDLCIEPVLVGKEGKFATEQELEDYVAFCVAPYSKHSAFYGIQLYDEPAYRYLEGYAHVYRVIKKLLPKAELQCNLLNMVAHSMIAPNPDCLQDKRKDYADYLRYFAKESGIDYLMTDEYAFRRNNVISSETVPVYETLAQLCKELGLELRLVMQSFCQEGCVINPDKPDEMYGGVSWRRMTKADMYWQMNLAMGFGCKEFSFFTYMTKVRKYFTGKRCVSDGIDGACFINLDGSRTKLYGYTKQIIKEMKDFERVILKYSFDKAYYFYPAGKCKEDYDATRQALDNTSGCPISIATSNAPIVVTELKNGKDSLYMIENIGNPMDEMLKGVKAARVKIDLSNLIGELRFYQKGKEVEIPLSEGKFEIKMKCGDAIFIERIQ